MNSPKMLQYYEKRTKKCVMGWIRELERELSGALKLPTVIKQICILYIKHIDNKDKICICGAEFKNASVHERWITMKQYRASDYQWSSIQCNFCDEMYSFCEIMNCSRDEKCNCPELEKTNKLSIKKILYCNERSKLHHTELNKCPSKCQATHEPGRIIWISKCKK